MKLVQNTYWTLKIGSIVLYLIVMLGVWSSAPKYLNIVRDAFMTLIAVILIYFFNPSRTGNCDKFQRSVVFTAGIAILFQLSVFHYLNPVSILKHH